MSEGILTVQGTLEGVLAVQSTLSGVVSGSSTLMGVVQPSTGYTPVIYDGEYEIIPKASDDVVLATKDKYLEDDVTVLRVPYYETSNLTGETVYIASEV